MPNPLTIRFLTDVKKLSLKFPATEISEKTGYSRSNISEYLNGKREPSNSFLQKFYSTFFPESDASSDITLNDPEEEILSKDKYIDSLRELIEAQKLTIKSLQERITDLEAHKGNTGGRRHSA